MRVQEVMTTPVVTVPTEATLERVRDLFQQHRFHHLIVLEHRRVVGVISDGDLLRHLSPLLGTAAERPVDAAGLRRRAHHIMSRTMVTVHAEIDLAAAGRLMREHRISCLPVVDARLACVGVVTRRDLLRGSADGPEFGAAA